MEARIFEIGMHIKHTWTRAVEIIHVLKNYKDWNVNSFVTPSAVGTPSEEVDRQVSIEGKGRGGCRTSGGGRRVTLIRIESRCEDLDSFETRWQPRTPGTVRRSATPGPSNDAYSINVHGAR